MKVLKQIMYIYLGILAISAFGLIILFPIILTVYFENDNYYWLFLINLPIILGFIFVYDEPISMRPKRY